MSKSIGGFLFIRNAIQYDYCVKEAIESLLEFCDEVAVVDACSDDGTAKMLGEMTNQKLIVQFLISDEWKEIKGKEKLSYFQNMAAAMLTTDYQFLCQADEVVHEGSYGAIRRAVESGTEGIMCTRFNLWGSPYTYLNVPHERMPCSTQVIRLSKRGYFTHDDGESISAPAINDFVEHIRLYHMGFVRKKEVMKDKIINMQQGVFEMADYDAKLKDMDVFDWRAWFCDEDLKPIGEPLPAVIQKWASERV